MYGQYTIPHIRHQYDGLETASMTVHYSTPQKSLNHYACNLHMWLLNSPVVLKNKGIFIARDITAWVRFFSRNVCKIMGLAF